MRQNTWVLMFIAAAALTASPAAAEERARKTIWDLQLSRPIAAQPLTIEYRGYACGAKGGPPRQPLKSFDDFGRCAPEFSGLREVVFEYDDELEYIARAKDSERDITRYAGTSEYGYSVIASALIDASGIVRGIRLVTDPRPDYRRDVSEADTRKRANAYQFGAVMAARFEIDAQQHCKSLPATDAESPVGSLFIKLECEKIGLADHRRVVLSVRMLRKSGQTDRDPRVPSQLTSGQFESSALLEIFDAP